MPESLPSGRSRAALVHDHFINPGGAERVAIELARLLPGADVLTSFVDPVYRKPLDGHRLRTWPLDRSAAARRRHRAFLPLYPMWFEALDTTSYDLVVSSSSTFGLGVRTGRHAVHIAYIHTPMRFAWDLEGYLAGSSMGLPSRIGATVLRPWLRAWDRRAARRPDVLVANSQTVAQRIRRVWGRDAEVIHPPVHIDDFDASGADEGYLLVAARLLRYRRVDLVVEAARRLDRELVVVGEGPELSRLRDMAGSRTRFLGHVPRERLVELFARCHAYVVPGEEDFGIAPVEAQAAGRPVVAFRAGGALETVVEDRTGVFFDQQTPESLAEAILRLDGLAFDPTVCRANAERFATAEFRRKVMDLFGRLQIDPALYQRGAD